MTNDPSRRTGARALLLLLCGTSLGLMAAGYMALFGSLWLMRIETEVRRRRATVLALKAAGN